MNCPRPEIRKELKSHFWAICPHFLPWAIAIFWPFFPFSTFCPFSILRQPIWLGENQKGTAGRGREKKCHDNLRQTSRQFTTWSRQLATFYDNFRLFVPLTSNVIKCHDNLRQTSRQFMTFSVPSPSSRPLLDFAGWLGVGKRAKVRGSETVCLGGGGSPREALPPPGFPTPTLFGISWNISQRAENGALDPWSLDLRLGHPRFLPQIAPKPFKIRVCGASGQKIGAPQKHLTTTNPTPRSRPSDAQAGLRHPGSMRVRLHANFGEAWRSLANPRCHLNCGPRGGTGSTKPGSGVQRFWSPLGASSPGKVLRASGEAAQGPRRGVSVFTGAGKEGGPFRGL